MRCGCTDNEFKQKILNERTNWSNHKGNKTRDAAFEDLFYVFMVKMEIPTRTYFLLTKS